MTCPEVPISELSLGELDPAEWFADIEAVDGSQTLMVLISPILIVPFVALSVPSLSNESEFRCTVPFAVRVPLF